MRRLAGVVLSICALLLCSLCNAQATWSINSNVFRENSLGLTYEFPETFRPKVGSEMPVSFHGDANGRERFILTLWDATDSGGALRMAFLYDTKERSSDRTHDTIALAYLGEIKGMWLGVKGVKIVGPNKVSEPSYEYWRMDFSTPDQTPRYNSAVVITLSDRRVLVVRAGAPSQNELDDEVGSLTRLRFDKSQK
jgi:hypothetical protein